MRFSPFLDQVLLLKKAAYRVGITTEVAVMEDVRIVEKEAILFSDYFSV